MYYNVTVINSVLMQELYLHGNSIGNEGVRALMTGLSLHKGLSKIFLKLMTLVGLSFLFLSSYSILSALNLPSTEVLCYVYLIC